MTKKHYHKKIGVISDTHGLLRHNVFELFKDVDLIVHAGDIGDIEILNNLNNIAKTIAVLGNTDHDYSFRHIARTELIDFDGKMIYLVHNLDKVDIDLKSAKIDIVIFGHTHRPDVFYKEGILFFNPGSAGPKRLDLPITAGLIDITDKEVKPKTFELI